MANDTNRDQRAAEMRETKARETRARYAMISNGFDSLLRSPKLTRQATRVLQSRTGCSEYFERVERGLGLGFNTPQDASQIAPTAGSARLKNASQKAHVIEANELVLARILASPDASEPADVWIMAGSECLAARAGGFEDKGGENAAIRDAGLTDFGARQLCDASFVVVSRH